MPQNPTSRSLQEMVATHEKELVHLATAVRCLSMDAVLKAKSGHVGLPLGGAEMGTLLYFAAMNHQPADSGWADRDRFVLSAGHGSMLQYSLLHLAGYNLPLEEIVAFRQFGSRTPGHPEVHHTEGIEVTTGPLGQGIANAVGMALAERMLAARLNTAAHTLVDHLTYVILGDGCMMEGVSGEACSLAGHLRLSKLVALYDANNITIDGTVDISFGEDVAKRYEAYGWNVLHADGNEFASLARALDAARANAELPQGTSGPTLVVCKGVAGKGSPKWEGKHKVHGNPMSAEDVVEAKRHLGIDNVTPFAVPEAARTAARALMAERVKKHAAWGEAMRAAKADWERSDASRHAFLRAAFEGEGVVSELPASVWEQAKGKMATRAASGKALSALAAVNPLLVGGSADLAGSNNTTLADSRFVDAHDFSGRNIHFGVREHGMGAISNGMALHGGLRPYCATFAVFSDYLRPTLRLAAIMKTPTVFILTHDSYAVGEDGPTHQPVEHAAALRAIPDLNVWRPADAHETFAAWEAALEDTHKPTALLLTRQDVPDLDALGASRTRESVAEGLRTGAYLLKDFPSAGGPRKVCLVASGSEVQLALLAAKLLEERSYSDLRGETTTLSVRVVSAPAPQLLGKNPVTLNTLLPLEIPLVAIEAGSPLGWGDVVGREGSIFGMQGFGASAPASALDAHFGFTPENIAEFVANHLSLR